MSNSKNIIVGKVNGVQLVTVENKRGSHTVICKLQDVPSMVEEIAELKGALNAQLSVLKGYKGLMIYPLSLDDDIANIEQILAKLNQEGVATETPEEKEALDRIQKQAEFNNTGEG